MKSSMQIPQQQTRPVAPQVNGDVQVRTFASKENPSSSDLKKLDKELNDFISTIARNPDELGIDDKHRLMQSITTLSVGSRLVTTVWFFDIREKSKITTLK